MVDNPMHRLPNDSQRQQGVHLIKLGRGYKQTSLLNKILLTSI